MPRAKKGAAGATPTSAIAPAARDPWEDSDFARLVLDSAGLTASSLADLTIIPRVRPQRMRIPPGRPGYIDLETIPDLERLPQFGLPELPPELPPMPIEAAPNQIVLATQPGEAVIAAMAGINPPDEWFTGMELAERAGKNRKGVLGEIDRIRAVRAAGGKGAIAAQERIKLLSVTPEYCKIAALGWAQMEEAPQAMVLGEEYREDAGRLVTEAEILEQFWWVVEKCSPIVGYNLLHFDLPVVFIRSAILGVEPTKRLDLRTWSSDVVDLFKVRWPTFGSGGMKLKDLARVLGIEVPCPDVDGSNVAALMAAGEFGKVAEYVCSDVVVEREVHRFYSGFFCP